MPLTSAEKMRRRIERLKQEGRYKEYLEKKRLHKQKSRNKKKDSIESQNPGTVPLTSAEKARRRENLEQEGINEVYIEKSRLATRVRRNEQRKEMHRQNLGKYIMDVDLDMKEHDFLEHQIQNRLPDVTRVKTEVPNADYGDQLMDTSSSSCSIGNTNNDYFTDSKLKKTLVSEIYKDLCDNFQNGEAKHVVVQKPIAVNVEIVRIKDEDEISEDANDEGKFSTILVHNLKSEPQAPISYPTDILPSTNSNDFSNYAPILVHNLKSEPQTPISYPTDILPSTISNDFPNRGKSNYDTDDAPILVHNLKSEPQTPIPYPTDILPSTNSNDFSNYTPILVHNLKSEPQTPISYPTDILPSTISNDFPNRGKSNYDTDDAPIVVHNLKSEPQTPIPYPTDILPGTSSNDFSNYGTDDAPILVHNLKSEPQTPFPYPTDILPSTSSNDFSNYGTDDAPILVHNLKSEPQMPIRYPTDILPRTISNDFPNRGNSNYDTDDAPILVHNLKSEPQTSIPYPTEILPVTFSNGISDGENSNHDADDAPTLVHTLKSEPQTPILYPTDILPVTFSNGFSDGENSNHDTDDEEIRLQKFKKILLQPIVRLENCGPKLERFSCYCKHCKILFPTVKRLRAHNKTAHSLSQSNFATSKSSQKFDIFNIIYQCKTCDILYDTYDQAVEHSQKHFNNIENYNVTAKHCHICNIKFDSICFDRHKALHAGDDNITRDYFKILTFDYTELFTAKWLDMFWDAPKHPKRQILLMSIYYCSRNVKLRVIKDGPQVSALFRCDKCEGHVHPTTLADHISSCNGEREGRYTCPLEGCGLQFWDPSIKDTHHAQHQLTQTFKIVLFNEESDKEFNETLIRHNTKTKIKFDKITYHYYQCTKCKCCLLFKSEISTHKCCFGSNRRHCFNCDLYFDWFDARHFRLHQNGMQIDRRIIEITSFDPNAIKFLDETTIIKLYKCDCGLHFNSVRAIEKHCKSCGVDKVSAENCKICNRLFDTVQLYTHMCKHHNTKFSTFEIIPRTKSKQSTQSRRIYKCSSCEYLFCDRIELKNHTPTCGSRSNRCSTCGLKFYSTLNHVLKHTDCSKLSIEDYNIINDTTKINEKLNILYKCYLCDVHYLKHTEVVHHIVTGHNITEAVPCQNCGLNFVPETLPKHISIQHDEHKYTCDDLIIETVQFSVQSTPVNDTVSKEQPSTSKRDTSKLIEETNNLYHCEDCFLNFMQFDSLKNHVMSCGNPVAKYNCELCGLLFSETTLKEHKKIQHEKLNFTLKDLNVIKPKFDVVDNAKEKEVDSKVLINSVLSCFLGQNNVKNDTNDRPAVKTEESQLNNDVFSNKLFKCDTCSINFLTSDILEWHTRNSKHDVPKSKCVYCGFIFTVNDLATHVFIHHERMGLNQWSFEISNAAPMPELFKNTRRMNP